MAENSSGLTIEMARAIVEGMSREEVAKLFQAAHPFARRCMGMEAYGREIKSKIGDEVTVGVNMGDLRSICDIVTEVMSR